ncbi:RNA-directed DNA polymerase from mobile element jockey [Biomphalaria glabrata]|nr:RNA-directed DNA polymerase from mobile element jockey-like [Biomphalaria glabrata]
MLVWILICLETCISVEFCDKTLDSLDNTPAILEPNNEPKPKALTEQIPSAKRKKRGRRGGIRVKCRRRGQRGFLPPIVTGKQELYVNFVTEDEVTLLFKRVDVTKASGPDKISGKLVKLCAEQISFIFCHIFNHSLQTCVIPQIWKTSEIIPVP